MIVCNRVSNFAVGSEAEPFNHPKVSARVLVVDADAMHTAGYVDDFKVQCGHPLEGLAPIGANLKDHQLAW